jgi:hypothetical protein
MSLLWRVKKDPFDDDLIEEIIMDSSEPIALAALERADCPPELLVDLSQNISPKVRIAVAKHSNVPSITKETLKNDPETTVSSAARGA